MTYNLLQVAFDAALIHLSGDDMRSLPFIVTDLAIKNRHPEKMQPLIEAFAEQIENMVAEKMENENALSATDMFYQLLKPMERNEFMTEMELIRYSRMDVIETNMTDVENQDEAVFWEMQSQYYLTYHAFDDLSDDRSSDDERIDLHGKAVKLDSLFRFQPQR